MPVAATRPPPPHPPRAVPRLAIAILLALISPAAAQPPARPHHVVPISGPLGLADLVLPDPDDRLQNATALLQTRTDPARTLEVPLHRPAPGANWTARLMAGESPDAETITFRLRLTSGGREQTLGPFTHAAAPPPNLRTPDWAMGAVWYQIFPERFRNGNPANDPPSPTFTPVPWLSDWSGLTPDELDLARARAMATDPPRRLPTSRRGGQRYNVTLDRRYGGDLQGVVERLDALADLGVTAIYLNPIFDAHSHHKYDASDYRHIDPTLAAPGPRDVHDRQTAHETDDPATWVWTDADRYLLDVLLPEARRRGIRIVLDGVWNHVGLRFWAFRDVEQHGAASRYASWFDVRFTPPEGPELDALRARHPEMLITPGMLINWQSWNGRNGTLPEFTRTSDGRLHPEVEAHIFAVTRRWMDPNNDGDPSDGIDGWRLDVVPDVPMPFWEAWRAHAKSINPDAILIAEVWFDAADYFNGRAFDAQMNYPFAMPVTGWIGARPDLTAATLIQRLERAFHHAPQVGLAQMNLLTSHDTERLASMLANPGRDYSQNARISSNANNYNTARPDAAAYERSLLGVAIQALYQGSPSIYYGDEYGVHGADDPDCRKPLPWPDLGPPTNPDDVPDPALRERYRDLLRHRLDPVAGPILRYGSVHHIPTDNPDLFIFERRLNADRLVAIINRADTPAAIPAAARYPSPITTIPPRTATAIMVRLETNP